MKLFSRKLLLVVILSIWIYGTIAVEPRGLMENINDGIKYAGQMFGINTAADVADLVSRAFSATQNKNRKQPTVPSSGILGLMPTPVPAMNAQLIDSEAKQQQSQEQMSTFNSSNLLTNVLRLIGFDVNKLSALAINALILIAQAIGSTFAVQAPPTPSTNDFNGHYDQSGHEEGNFQQNERQKRELRNGTPIDWFLEKPTSNMRNLLDRALDANITQQLIRMVSNTERGDGEGECLKMLLCRSAPFIWGMQKTLQHRIENTEQDEIQAPIKTSSTTTMPPKIEAAIFRHMPTLAEYRQHAKICTKKHGNKCRQIGKK